MKKIFLTCTIIAALASCKPEDPGEIGQALSVITGIDGSWQMNMVEVNDRTIPGGDKRDFTAYYTTMVTPMVINFTIADNSYAVQNSIYGDPFGLSGVYAFNDDEFPTQIYMIPTGQDTLKIDLAAMVRATDDFLSLSNSAKGCESTYADYIFTFKRM